MPDKKESTSSEEPTLRDIHERLSSIENQLGQQDKRAKHETLFTIGAFGTSIFLVGITLRVTNPAPSLIDDAMSILLIVWGCVIVTWAWCRFRKIKNKSKP